MKHSFDWSSDVGDFFFKGLTINSATSLSVLCLALAIFAIIYESMKVIYHIFCSENIFGIQFDLTEFGFLIRCIQPKYVLERLVNVNERRRVRLVKRQIYYRPRMESPGNRWPNDLQKCLARH